MTKATLSPAPRTAAKQDLLKDHLQHFLEPFTIKKGYAASTGKLHTLFSILDAVIEKRPSSV